MFRSVASCHVFTNYLARSLVGRIISHRCSTVSRGDSITVHYISKDGSRKTLQAKEGDNAMRLAQENGIEIEGACEASLACCTCHVYVSDDHFDRLPTPDEREDDMLDLAPFLKTNSRLSCQIIFTKDLDGIELTLPPATRNFYVDGKVPSHH